MTTYFQMRGIDTVCPAPLQPAYVNWVVTGTPDLSATRCPIAAMLCGVNPPADLATIQIVEQWIDEIDWEAARVLHVGQAPQMYPTVVAAVAAIPTLAVPPAANNRLDILVWPNKYITNAIIDVPSHVTIKGMCRETVQFQNDVTSIFRAAGTSVWLRDFTIEGSPTAGIYAIDGNNQDRLHVRNVDMLNNMGTSRQSFLRQVGATFYTMFVENCIVDGYLLTGVLGLIQNTSGAVRDIDIHIRDVFWDALHLNAAGGCLIARDCLNLWVRNSLIRVIAGAYTGIRIENTGVAGTANVEADHCTLIGTNPCYGTVNTNYNLINTDAFGATTAGTRNIYNSRV